MKVSYKVQPVRDVDVFYREAGPRDAPVLLLLHGFPAAGHMFRDLIPELAPHYRVFAPDLPGFGNTKAPPRGSFAYTFDHLAEVVDGFLAALGIDRFAMYLFDYGAPVGFRIAAAHPERITGLVVQNGNAYIEGLSDGWGDWKTYWRDPTPAHREACRQTLTWEFVRDGQYLHGTKAGAVSPDGYTLDMAYLARPEAEEVQLDLCFDYQTNLARYDDFHAYFRTHRPPCLVVWGRHDLAFVPAGAEAFRKDLPSAEIHLLDTGHFALETHAEEIGALMIDFLQRTAL